MLFAHSFTFEGRLVGTRAIEEVGCAYHKYVVSSKNLGFLWEDPDLDL